MDHEPEARNAIMDVKMAVMHASYENSEDSRADTEASST